MPKWRKVLLLATSALLLGWIVFGTVGYFLPPSEEEAASQLGSVTIAQSFRFQSQCEVLTGTEVRQYFDISGAKSGQDLYFTGTILGTETTLYLVDGVAYQQSNGGEWRVNEVTDLSEAVTLFSELDPSAAINYTELSDFQYLGVAKVEDSTYFHLLFKPLQQGWVEEYFDDILYTVLIPRGKKDHFIVEVSGNLAEDPQVTLDMAITFYDIDEDITITAPEV